jgi:hypothetical protein
VKISWKIAPKLCKISCQTAAERTTASTTPPRRNDAVREGWTAASPAKKPAMFALHPFGLSPERWPCHCSHGVAVSLTVRRERPCHCSHTMAVSLAVHTHRACDCSHTVALTLIVQTHLSPYTHTGLNTHCSHTPAVSPFTHNGVNDHCSHTPACHRSHTMALTLTVHTQRACHSLFTHEFYFLYFSLVLSGHQISFPFSKL